MAMLIYHIERHVQADSLRNLREQVTLRVRVSIFPITLGTGKRLFAGGTAV
jgi:hypothetical protein